MTTIRFAHIADTHLGYRALNKVDPVTGRNQRALDIERAYEIAIDDILTRDVQLVIHAGDVFHHTRPTWSAMRCFVRHTKRLSDAGIRTVVIGGNHDTPRLRSSGSVFSVLELALPDIQFVCAYEDEFIRFDDLNVTIHAIPHGKLADPNKPTTFPLAGRRNILVTHGLASDVQLRGGHREPGEEDIADHLLDETFDYIALGHYHVHHRSRHNAWYSGSTERYGFGDEDVTPGYAIVELNDNEPPAVTPIPVEARPMKTIAPVDCAGRNAREIVDIIVRRLERDVDPATMARVELRDATRAVRREVESILKREVAGLCWSLQIFARGDLLAAPGERSAVTGSMDIRSLFDEFVPSRSYEARFAAAFQDRGRRALDDAIRASEPSTQEELG